MNFFFQIILNKFSDCEKCYLFGQERSPEGQYSFALDPNIEDMVKFSIEGPARRPFSYTAKQLVAREVELEKVREAFF